MQNPIEMQAALTRTKRDIRRNNQKTYMLTSMLLAYVIASEYQGTAYYSRPIVFLLFVLLYELHKNGKEEAALPLRALEAKQFEHDAHAFRSAAYKNDREGVEGFLIKYARDKVNVCGKESHKNALHFAVRGQALECVNYLVRVDKNNAIEAPNIPNLLTHQDSLGNTPVHEAILFIIGRQQANEAYDFDILNTLLTGEKPPAIKPGFLNTTEKEKVVPVVNPRVNVLIANHEGYTISSLMEQVKPVNKKGYFGACAIIDRMLKLEQPASQATAGPSL